MRVSGIPYVQGRNAYADKDGLKFGIAIHNTSNNASAENESQYATTRTDGVSSHFYVDNDSIIQSIDTRDRCGHAGSNTGNENAVCVEITGQNGWTRDQWLANVAWDKLAAALKQVIAAHWPDGSFQIRRASVAEMQSNPKVKAFYGHDDMRQAWGGTDHTDPGPGFPWDKLFSLFTNAPVTGGTDMALIFEDRDNRGHFYVLGGANDIAEVKDINSLGWVASGRFFSGTSGVPMANPVGAYYGNPKNVDVAPWIEIPVIPMSALAVKAPATTPGTCPSLEQIGAVVQAELQENLGGAKISTTVAFPPAHTT